MSNRAEHLSAQTEKINALGQERITLMLRICEERIQHEHGSPIERRALAASALAVQEALKTFSAVDMTLKNK